MNSRLLWKNNRSWCADCNCSNSSAFLTLLWYFACLKHRLQSRVVTLAWSDLSLYHTVIQTGGSRISVAASRMKFFVTTVNGWESLTVATKKLILVTTGVLDPPLLQIEMSKSNKTHKKERGIY